MFKDKRAGKAMKKIVIILVVVVVMAAVGGVMWFGLFAGKGGSAAKAADTFVVRRGPLRICIIESGSVKSREQIILKSKVEGRVSILSIVPEGAIVKKDDLLVELDSSKLKDSKIDQEIRVQNTEASLTEATEKLAVTKNQAQSDIDKAVLTLDFAEQDLEKYIKGEYPNKLKAVKAKITLAEEELQRAEERLEWSLKLEEKEYISKTELEADRLAEKKKKLDVELAESDFELLKNYIYKREIARIESDVKQADMALERARRKARADIVQAEATLRARQAEDKRQKDKLKKILEQLTNSKIYSPAGGQVIYATTVKRNRWDNKEPLKEGVEVREREELIYLPTANEMNAEVKIHEASVKKIKLGQKVTITIGALPNKVFTGRISRIAPLPDQSVWFNPDLKVYNTEIEIDTKDNDLRTGMSCKSDILIEEYEDAVYVPVQCVIRAGDKRKVYVETADGISSRIVETGLDDNRMIRIINGLEVGEKVLLSPPLSEGQVSQESGEDSISSDGKR